MLERNFKYFFLSFWNSTCAQFNSEEWWRLSFTSLLCCHLCQFPIISKWTGKPCKTILGSSRVWTQLSGVGLRGWSAALQRERPLKAAGTEIGLLGQCMTDVQVSAAAEPWSISVKWSFLLSSVKLSSAYLRYWHHEEAGLGQCVCKYWQIYEKNTIFKNFICDWNITKYYAVPCDTAEGLTGFWNCLFKVFTSSLDVESW